MTLMKEDEIKKLLDENPHLRLYVEEAQKKLGRPEFHSALGRDLKGNKYPNLIYPTKGVVFIHLFRTKDMDEIEYHAIEPTLTEIEQKKRERVLERIYERAPRWKTVKTDDEIRESVKELLNEIVVVTEKASSDVEKKGFFGGIGSGKIRVTPSERIKLEYNITKDMIGGGPLEPFMRDPYIEDVHVITGQKVHLIHKIYEMVKTNNSAVRSVRDNQSLMGHSLMGVV
jgi:flagellar protein FlaI